MQRLILMIVLMFAIVPAFAQTRYSGADTGPKKALYLLASAGRPNYGDEWIYGGTVGGSIQWKPYLGLDAHFTDLPMGASGVHQFFIGTGPRGKISRGRFQLFGNVDGGLGHVEYRTGPWVNGSYHAAGAQSGFGYFLTGGVDYALTRRLSVRLGEFDYGKISVLDSGLNPKVFSSGIVLNLF